jgi:signal-transduction protein with cAMP-binding, CBS, and nucleotidyltransferase domain
MENASQDKIIEVLKKIPFFREFTDEDLSLLLKITQWIRFQSGDIIIKEGSSEKNFFIILKGSVSIRKRTGVGAYKKTICNLSMGQSFGEMSFVTGKPRSADIVAEEDTYVIRFNSEDIQREQKNPRYAPLLLKFYKKFSEILAERLENADKQLVKPFM